MSNDFPNHETPIAVSIDRSSAGSRDEYRGEVEIVLISRGTGACFIHHRHYPFRRNSVLIMHHDEVHNYIPDPGSSVSKISLHFSMRVLDADPAAQSTMRSLRESSHLILSDDESRRLRALLDELGNRVEDRQSGEDEAITQGIADVLAVLERVRVDTGSANRSHDRSLEQVLTYLEDHYKERVSLGETARRFALSPDYLTRELKRYVGLGFKQYVTQRRIAEAKTLLRSTNLTISAIAYDVGFDDVSSFNRGFRLLVGTTPSAYRGFSS